MTHKDIYTKFMIEYDKANVTSSYPSLTEYEVATVLDKAYNALIAQKVTGNNVRRVALEGDLKNVVDLQPLVKKYEYNNTEVHTPDIDGSDIDNTIFVSIPDDFLYYIGCNIKKLFQVMKAGSSHYSSGIYAGPIDQEGETGSPVRLRKLPVKLISHQMAEKFKADANNIPWVKNPVCYIENDTIFIVYDSYDQPLKNFCELTYIKEPNKFVKPVNGSIDDIESYFNISDDTSYDYIKKLSYFEYELENGWSSYDRDLEKNVSNRYEFECNDTVAEELISLAVAFALENVESQRLNSKLNMRGLEA